MKRVIFVCIENSCRSQMAEGFARLYGSGKVEAFSAGTMPADRIELNAVHVMAEIGFDISKQRPKRVDQTGVEFFDMAVTMGCMDAGQACPLVPAKEIVEWDIPDPRGKSIEVFREVRDMMHAYVKSFIEEIM